MPGSPVWSKSFPHKPKPNLISHIQINKRPFKASYEKDPLDPPSMALILAGEYARIWQKEHCEFKKKTTKKKSSSNTINKEIVARYNKWVAQYKSKLMQRKIAAALVVK